MIAATAALFLWLLATNDVPGLPAQPGPHCGVQVFMDAEDPAVTAFDVTLTVEVAGEERTVTAHVPRDHNAGAVYSTSTILWVADDWDFRVVSVQVDDVKEPQ